MARRYVFKNSCAAGEIAPEYLMRTDSQARNEGLKTARNIRIVQGGGFARAPGTIDIVGLPGDARLETLGVGTDDAEILVFYSNGFRVLDLDGATVQDITGAPWGFAQLRTMQVQIEGERIVVSSQDFAPTEILRTAGVWAIQNLTYADGLDGSILQPYWQFNERGVSLTPSDYTGTIDLLTSEDYFDAGHIGTRIRYAGVEIAITAVADAQNATGTVIGNLYPTISVKVADASGFLVGQEVQGEDSQILGVVSDVPDGTHIQVQLIDGYSYFDWTDASESEKIIGPTARVAQTDAAPVLVAQPAATVQWDEQMISQLRGYPGASGLHRTRLLLGDFPEAQNALVASALNDVTDFDVGSGLDSDAIVERIGRESSLGIKHFGSAEQLLIFTEAGIKYVPEQVGAPFSPTNIELLTICPEVAGDPTPLLVSEGMLFTEDTSGRLMIVSPTGNVRRSWDVADLSEMAFHLMGTPTEIELQAASGTADRTVHVLRDDGKMCVLTYRRSAQFAAWVLWETTGSWKSVVAVNGVLYAVAERTLDGSTVYRLEKFDSGVYGHGIIQADEADAFTLYANETVSIWDGAAYLGDYEVDAAGLIVDLESGYGAISVGLDFELTAALVPPIDSDMGLRQKIRICRVDLDVVDTIPVQVNGYDATGWPSNPGVGGHIDPSTGVRRFRPIGRSKDGTVTITQEHGGPLLVRSITMEVTS